jgi:hypothetical protein
MFLLNKLKSPLKISVSPSVRPSVRCGPCFSRSEGEHSSRAAQSRKTGVETISEFTNGKRKVVPVLN